MTTSPRTLGNSSLTVSAITLGTSGLGRATRRGIDDTDALALAAAMLAGPFRAIDTSNEYAGGRSEEVLGDAMRQSTVDDPPMIITKVDRDPETGAFDRDRVWRSFDESRARLGLERIELLHLHDPYTVTIDEALAPGGAVEGLRELKEQGLVDAIGIAAGPLPLLQRFVDEGALDVLLSHNRFTIVDSDARALFESARSLGMGVMNAAPFGGGILGAGTPDRYGYREIDSGLPEWINQARAVCARHGVELRTVALHHSLRSPLVDTTVVGISRPERIAELEAMVAAAPPDEIWADLAELGPAPSPFAGA